MVGKRSEVRIENVRGHKVGKTREFRKIEGQTQYDRKS